MTAELEAVAPAARRRTAARVGVAESSSLRATMAAPAVAAVTTAAALIATHAAGVRFQDPDHVAAGYVAMVGAAVALLVGLDVVMRGARLEARFPPSRGALRQVRRTRWTRRRGVAVGGALLSFYATYLAYRNLKGVLPLLRPGVLVDDHLAAADRAVFGGQ